MSLFDDVDREWQQVQRSYDYERRAKHQSHNAIMSTKGGIPRHSPSSADREYVIAANKQKEQLAQRNASESATVDLAPVRRAIPMTLANLRSSRSVAVTGRLRLTLGVLVI